MTGWLAGILLTLVGGLIGATITHARIARRSKTAGGDREERPGTLSSLQELSYHLSETLDLDVLARHVVDHLDRAIPADGVLLALQDRDEGVLAVLCAVGTLTQLQGRRVGADDAGLLVQAVATEHIVAAQTEEDDGRPDLVRGCPVAMAAVSPLLAHGVTSGVLAVTRDKLLPFSADDLRHLSTVAGYAATVVEKARFVEVVQSGKRHWEATFDAIADGIAVLDGEGRIRRANQALGRIANRPVQEIIGRELAPLLVADSGTLEEFLSAARSDASGKPFAFRERPGGRALKVTVSRLPGPGPDWAVVLIEDVTEREVLEAQLLHNEKMAAVGQLVSGVAHELNNPLSSIAGLADFLLNREPESPPDREHLQLIHEQADRAGKIVRNLLYFARKGPAEPANVDLNDVTRRAAALIGHEMRVRDIDLRMDLFEPLPPVRGDRHELQQVLLNLITNAIQAVQQNGPGRPRVVTLTTRHEGDQVRLRVADSGPGIPDELRSQVFLPFFTTKEPGQGTGLGLSICFRIVEAHGGGIVVSSPSEGGTQFEVRLPAATPEPRVTPERPAARRSPQGRRVLVMDEDPALLTTLGIVLGDGGHLVDSASSAPAALELLDRCTYDLIIAEPLARGPDGRAFADILCSDRSDLSSRTLLLTADIRPETSQWLIGLNCRVLRKPFDSRELQEAVASILDATPEAH